MIIESEDGQIEATGSDVFSTLQGLMTNPATGMPNGAGFAHAGAMGAGSLGAATGGYPGATGIPGSPGTTGGGPMGSNTLGGSPNTGQGGVSAAATANLVDTLTLLQQGDMSGLGHSAIGVLDQGQLQAGNVNVLRTLKESGAVGDVNQTDGLTLDIVTILFDYILDDPAIPDAMKALIGRLQIPMLKVALFDKALFSKKMHPARRLLDALAAAAVG